MRSISHLFRPFLIKIIIYENFAIEGLLKTFQISFKKKRKREKKTLNVKINFFSLNMNRGKKLTKFLLFRIFLIEI